LNINSYAGGAKMWAENSPKSSKNGENVDNIIFDSSKVEINDGLLEIVAVTGTYLLIMSTVRYSYHRQMCIWVN
jgi:hypothetical protein